MNVLKNLITRLCQYVTVSLPVAGVVTGGPLVGPVGLKGPLVGLKGPLLVGLKCPLLVGLKGPLLVGLKGPLLVGLKGPLLVGLKGLLLVGLKGPLMGLKGPGGRGRGGPD